MMGEAFWWFKRSERQLCYNCFHDSVSLGVCTLVGLQEMWLMLMRRCPIRSTEHYNLVQLGCYSSTAVSCELSVYDCE